MAKSTRSLEERIQEKDLRAQKLIEQAKQVEAQRKELLNGKYEVKTAVYEGTLIGFVAYALLITLFTAVRSEIFMMDFKQFFLNIWNLIIEYAEWTIWAGRGVAEVGNQISNSVAATTIYWILFFIVIVIIVGVVLAAVHFAGKRVRKLYYEFCWDKIKITIMVATASFAFVIFFGDWIRKKVPINLIIILLLVQLGYMIVRWYVKGCRINRGY